MSYSRQLVADRYRLTSIIGSGGMGRVWLARDEVLHRDVAVKEVVLPEDMPFEERNELCQRTLREARAAGRLNHPNVVAVYDVVQAEGRPWIVMELIRSKSLYQTVKENGPVSPREAAQIGLSILAALRAAHKAGVWHRDVKPGNVLLADDGRVVLTDFGLATFEGDGTVTRSGVILGSAQYIAPERARDGAFGPESDMWSLGATLYAAVEGRSPYARDTPMATLTALATAPPDPPRRAGPLRQVLIGLLRKNPRQRMRAGEAERLLIRVAAGDTRGRRVGVLGRSRAVDEPAVLSDDESTGHPPAPVSGAPVAPASVTAADAPPMLVGSAGVRDRQLHTATEETFRHVSTRRRAWPWVVGILALAAGLVVPTLAYLQNRQSTGTVASPTGSPSPSPTRVLTEAMRVQACRDQTADRETPVPPGGEAALDNWATFHDPSGFAVNVPLGWGVSRIGALLCFRDPTSLKTVAVYDHGVLQGNPLVLVADVESWRTAANLTDFKPVGVRDLYLPDGGAVLEYTYQRDKEVKMHGQNAMMRLGGRVFTIYGLTNDGAWALDKDIFLAVDGSFHLAS